MTARERIALEIEAYAVGDERGRGSATGVVDALKPEDVFNWLVQSGAVIEGTTLEPVYGTDTQGNAKILSYEPLFRFVGLNK